MVKLSWIKNDDLVASLLRKQITDLTAVLREMEQGNPLKDYAHENLLKIEKQIRWLRKVTRENYL